MACSLGIPLENTCDYRIVVVVGRTEMNCRARNLYRRQGGRSTEQLYIISASGDLVTSKDSLHYMQTIAVPYLEVSRTIRDCYFVLLLVEL
jgi:hypothetical protein